MEINLLWFDNVTAIQLGIVEKNIWTAMAQKFSMVTSSAVQRSAACDSVDRKQTFQRVLLSFN